MSFFRNSSRWTVCPKRRLGPAAAPSRASDDGISPYVCGRRLGVPRTTMRRMTYSATPRAPARPCTSMARALYRPARRCKDGSVVSAAASNLAPLLGREAEVELLTSLLGRIENGGGTLVLRGEPGIGKSRLLAEAAALARKRDFRVLSATGVQSEAHLAFAGLHQLLRPVRFRAAGLPATQRAALDAAFGLGQESAPERFRIALAVLDLLCDVATDAPLLVVADDAQWLDHPPAEVLAFFARRGPSEPIVLLAATRDGYPSPLVDAGLREYRLGGLEPAAAVRLLDA